MSSPSFNLRPYQREAIDAINEKWLEWSRELLVLPTGCGKTVVFNTIASQRPGSTLILAHRDELIEQARDKYEGPRSTMPLEEREYRSHRTPGQLLVTIRRSMGV